MSEVDVTINKAQWRRTMALMKKMPRGVPRVLARAVNDTTRTTQIHTAKAIAEEIGFRPAEVKRGLAITERATIRHWQGRVSITAGRIPLIAFSPRKTSKGVSYKIGGQQKFIRGAFIAAMPQKLGGGQSIAGAGHRGVFVRKSEGGELVGRTPIFERFGPSLTAVFDEDRISDVAAVVMAQSGDTLQKNINRGLDWLSRAQRAG